METIINLIDHWQTLVGAILGGLFALGVALLVAHHARRREEVSAATLLVGNLVSVQASHSALFAQADKEIVHGDALSRWIAEMLVRSRPRLSVLFEPSMVRVMPLCTKLSAHLSLFHTIYADVNHHLDRLEADFEEARLTGKLSRSKEALNADAKLAHEGFEIAAEHARCAERLLNHVVLSKLPMWHRMKRVIWPSKDERKCKRLLKKGGI